VKMLLKAVAKLTKMKDTRKAKHRVGPEPVSTASDDQSEGAGAVIPLAEASSTEMAKPDLVTEIASFPNSPAKDTPNSPAKDTSADKPAADGAAPAPAPDPPPPPPPAAE